MGPGGSVRMPARSVPWRSLQTHEGAWVAHLDGLHGFWVVGHIPSAPIKRLQYMFGNVNGCILEFSLIGGYTHPPKSPEVLHPEVFATYI
jgi:hypothetical protein